MTTAKRTVLDFAFFATIIMTLLSFASCRNEKKSTVNMDEINILEKEYQKSKNDTVFTKLIQVTGKSIIDAPDMATKELLIKKAIQWCNTPEKYNYKEVFSTELLKVNPDADISGDILWNLAEAMLNRNKPEIASVLFSGFKYRYASDPRSKETEKYISTDQKDIHKYISVQAEAVFNSPGPLGINEAAAQQYIDICESFALAMPKDKMAPEYLFRAAEIARALRSMPKMMSLYDWIYTYFPNYKKAPLALFLKGFAMDSEFKKPQEAKAIYETFLARYPQDSLSKDVTFLLNNIGKSDEEILKALEEEKK